VSYAVHVIHRTFDPRFLSWVPTCDVANISHLPLHTGELQALALAGRPRVVRGAVLPGKAVQVDPVQPTLKAPGTRRLKVQYDELLSSFPSIFYSRRYNLADFSLGAEKWQDGAVTCNNPGMLGVMEARPCTSSTPPPPLNTST